MFQQIQGSVADYMLTTCWLRADYVLRGSQEETIAYSVSLDTLKSLSSKTDIKFSQK